jgi:hypothetical protein
MISIQQTVKHNYIHLAHPEYKSYDSQSAPIGIIENFPDVNMGCHTTLDGSVNDLLNYFLAMIPTSRASANQRRGCSCAFPSILLEKLVNFSN